MAAADREQTHYHCRQVREGQAPQRRPLQPPADGLDDRKCGSSEYQRGGIEISGRQAVVQCAQPARKPPAAGPDQYHGGSSLTALHQHFAMLMHQPRRNCTGRGNQRAAKHEIVEPRIHARILGVVQQE
jgi:hypothetical protein